MLVDVLATVLLSLCVLTIAGDLRSVAADLGCSFCKGVRSIRFDRRLFSCVAFSCLWLMIFGLSY